MSPAPDLIRGELAPLLPLPAGSEPDWLDVVRRARRRHRVPAGHRRLLVVSASVAAAVVAAFATPLGATVGRVLGDFSAWLSGTPGTPVSPAEQRAFQEANERSWTAFAPGTKLRRLIETTSGGTSFTLYGFRTGDALCLRLAAAGEVTATSTHCAPLKALQTARAPALVVAADEPLGTTNRPANAEGYVPEAYNATFGIASDGVEHVVLHADDGTHDAFVGGNAFLYVADHPRLGTRVRSAEAIAVDGARVGLSLESSPFGMLDLPPPPPGRPRGPARVQRHVDGGSIGWIERLEPRGEPAPQDLAKRLGEMSDRMLAGQHPLLTRILQPDPNDFLRIGLLAASSSDTMTNADSRLCFFDIGRASLGGGCERLATMFSRVPFTVTLGGSGPSQYSLLSGLASDDVATMKLFLASGAVVAVALRDNAYLARVARSDFPIRLVAYDASGRVIGTQTFRDDGMTSAAPPAARASVHELARVTADRGATAVYRGGRPLGGYRCWTIAFSDGKSGGGCTPWPPRDPPLLLVGATPVGKDGFIDGQVPPAVASVTVTFVDGNVVKLDPIQGFVLYAIPGRHLRSGRAFVALAAFDAGGKRLARRGLTVDIGTG